ncbi:TerD family protein [Streptomyces sp. NPDC091259]|uniref:TerD family protein n=1 Tax=Streptomyces sp. NPDC091259 TaxID=3365976 RepID=UPI00380A4846
MTITLTKADGAADLAGVTKMSIGASWDTTGGGNGGLLGWAKRVRGTDLDAVAILMQGADPVRIAGLDSLDPVGNGSVVHSGDNQTGHGAGDDERIDVVFANVPGHVDSIVFVCAAFKPGSSFDKASNVSFKVYDASDGVPGQVADIWPSLLGGGNAVAVAKAVRAGDSWTLEVINSRGTVRQGDRASLMRFAMGH